MIPGLLLSPVITEGFDGGSDESVGRRKGSEVVIPDQVNSEALRSVEPVKRMEVLNGSVEEGESAGFWPTWWQDPDGREYVHPVLKPFEEVVVVPDGLKSKEYEFPKNTLVVNLGDVPDTLLPVDGYNITKVIQEGGGLPLTSDMGELRYQNEVPEEVILVMDKIVEEQGQAVRESEFKGPEYSPWSDWEEKLEKAKLLNGQLAGDQSLQKIHEQMVTEADGLVQQRNSGEIDEAELRLRWSEMAKRFTEEFWKYSTSTRPYSLSYKPSGSGGRFGNLVDISQQPGVGYYCIAGNMAFGDFMESIGVVVLNRVGENLRFYKGGLWGRLGHVNSWVMLPDGRILSVDMTPYRPNPGEDLSMLKWREPRKGRFHVEVPRELLDELKLVLLGVGAMGGVGVGAEAVRRKVKSRKERWWKRLVKEMPDDEEDVVRVLRGLELALIWAVAIGVDAIFDKNKELNVGAAAPNEKGTDRKKMIDTGVGEILSLLEKEDVGVYLPREIGKIVRRFENVVNKELEEVDGTDVKRQKRQVKKVMKSLRRELRVRSEEVRVEQAERKGLEAGGIRKKVDNKLVMSLCEMIKMVESRV